MRYFLPLLFFPFAAFAGCAPGVNYGSAHIVSPNPICYVYSGSTQGGCYAYCGGGSDGAVCVELPNAVPPTRGPYFSSGQECTPNDNNGPGKDPNPPVGEDGTATGGDGVVNMGELWVGQNSHADLGKGFNVVSNNIRVSSDKVVGEIKKLDMDFKLFSDTVTPLIRESSQDLNRIVNNTGSLANAIWQSSGSLETQLMMLNGKQVLDSSYWNNKEERLIGLLNDIRTDMSYMGGFPNQQELININQNTNSMANDLANMNNNIERQGYVLFDMLGELKKISSGQGGGSGGGGGGEGGDKPCEGPLCDFTNPPASSGSGLSSVFSEESIADVKKQVEAKDGEIIDAMRDVKSLFISEELTISGTYNNDYQDIHGVKVDLSGKSNMELFFNSGPRTAIWFLAVLVAFSILMGGRKNA